MKKNYDSIQGHTTPAHQQKEEEKNKTRRKANERKTETASN